MSLEFLKMVAAIPRNHKMARTITPKSRDIWWGPKAAIIQNIVSVLNVTIRILIVVVVVYNFKLALVRSNLYWYLICSKIHKKCISSVASWYAVKCTRVRAPTKAVSNTCLWTTKFVLSWLLVWHRILRHKMTSQTYGHAVSWHHVMC
jgi:hypothetical protein